MSLYHEVATILTQADRNGGSIKSLTFGKKNWKNDAKILYALATETAKWSDILSEVVERSGILKIEKNLTPILAILLVHDAFLAKKGIALPPTHGLNIAVSRHKVRLSAELTKARLRRGFASIDALRGHVNSVAADGQNAASSGERVAGHPRWIRINTLKTRLEDELITTFSDYSKARSLKEVTHAVSGDRILHVDEHIPNLIAIAGTDDPTTFNSYKTGRLILQEKASCFPAYLLDPTPGEGDVIDACAAPGNKTTHVSAILAGLSSRVIACEKDPERSKTLKKMVRLAGANTIVTIRKEQNFLKLDPWAKEFAAVTALLLDPSCSGSGIWGRDETKITVHLPSTSPEEGPKPRGKKRKREAPPTRSQPRSGAEDALTEETPDQEVGDASKLQARLENLSTFQLRLLLHAMSFPSAKRITYSTCSVHAEENEKVVVRALLSDVAFKQGWRVLRRAEQVDGMQRWHVRGVGEAVRSARDAVDISEARRSDLDIEEVQEACIRCEKGGEDGTMGFFVAGFIRNVDVSSGLQDHQREANGDDEEEDEWEGFGDDDEP